MKMMTVCLLTTTVLAFVLSPVIGNHQEEMSTLSYEETQKLFFKLAAPYVGMKAARQENIEKTINNIIIQLAVVIPDLKVFHTQIHHLVTAFPDYDDPTRGPLAAALGDTMTHAITSLNNIISLCANHSEGKGVRKSPENEEEAESSSSSSSSSSSESHSAEMLDLLLKRGSTLGTHIPQHDHGSHALKETSRPQVAQSSQQKAWTTPGPGGVTEENLIQLLEEAGKDKHVTLADAARAFKAVADAVGTEHLQTCLKIMPRLKMLTDYATDISDHVTHNKQEMKELGQKAAQVALTSVNKINGVEEPLSWNME